MSGDAGRPQGGKVKAGLLAAGGGVLLIASLLASALRDGGDCELSFEPHVVPSRGHPVLIHAIPTRPLPAVDDLTLPDASGLVVSPSGAHPYRFLVNPVEAAEGDWRLSLRSGGVDVCSGNLIVGPRRLPEIAPRFAREPAPPPR